MSEQYSSAALKINGGDLATTRHDIVARLKRAGELLISASDGERFVFIANNSSCPATPNDSGKLSVILNWTATLHKK